MHLEEIPDIMTEKVPVVQVSSLHDLCTTINKAIKEQGFIYKCEVTLDTWPKTHVEYTIKWISPYKQDGTILAQFLECSQPQRITLPLRIWTIL